MLDANPHKKNVRPGLKCVRPGLLHVKPGLTQGASLYLGLLLIATLMAISLSLATLSLFQIKSIKGLGNSLVAFFSADTAIEKVLYDDSRGVDITICTRTNPCEGNINPEISYRIVVLSGGQEECPPDRTLCIETVGIFRETRRAIRITK